MKIQSIEVKGLSHKIDAVYEFNGDINVITGINGTGKTTLLKLVWYIISSNVERIAPEINYGYIKLVTDIYEVELTNNQDTIHWKFVDDEEESEGEYEIANDEINDTGSEEVNRRVMKSGTSSLYFPTFRRIEGGYSMANTRKIRRRLGGGRYISEVYEHDDIQDEMESVSRRLSVQDHKFI